MIQAAHRHQFVEDVEGVEQGEDRGDNEGGYHLGKVNVNEPLHVGGAVNDGGLVQFRADPTQCGEIDDRTISGALPYIR